MDYPLKTEQTNATRRLRSRMLPPEPGIVDLERYRKALRKLVAEFDLRRDAEFPGWRTANA